MIITQDSIIISVSNIQTRVQKNPVFIKPNPLGFGFWALLGFSDFLSFGQAVGKLVG